MMDTAAFEDIRPYRDEEVVPVLRRVLANPELMLALSRLRFPRWPLWARRCLVPVIRWRLRREVAGVRTIDDFQRLVERIMTHMIRTTVTDFTVSGLEQLTPGQSYLFMSNHRDIALDPAFVDYALYHHGHPTVRIAIGDNLLTKAYASDLMRLNKSFIVKRSIGGGKELLRASRTLAQYIRFSLEQEEASVWLAQREGRAKDGRDRTERAVLKMLDLARQRKSESVSDFVRGLRIVPVAISYEFDPCDAAKARELHLKSTTGAYAKGEHEDVASIAQGISGQKGAVHLAFGAPLQGEYADMDAVVEALDRRIVDQYVLHPSNYFAWQALHGDYPTGSVGAGGALFDPSRYAAEREAFERRLQAVDAELRPRVLTMYANAIASKQALGCSLVRGGDSGDAG